MIPPNDQCAADSIPMTGRQATRTKLLWAACVASVLILTAPGCATCRGSTHRALASAAQMEAKRPWYNEALGWVLENVLWNLATYPW